MLRVTDSAGTALKKVFEGPEASGKHLVIYFQGYGWGGPSLGMALEESVDELEALQSNGVTAYIDANLKAYVTELGGINIDFVNRDGGGGYMVTVGDPNTSSGCGTGGCSSC